jgi:hypothetical protein
MTSQIPRRTQQIKRYYLDRRQAEKHCEDIEAYMETELRAYIKYAANHLLEGSTMTHRQRVDFVRSWMRSWLADDALHRRIPRKR